MRYSRNKLIQLCERAVVPCEKWVDRDSYSCQLSIDSIYRGLKSGVKFTTKTEKDTIWVTFEEPTEEQLLNIKNLTGLPINSRLEYHEKVDPEFDTEMFDGIGIDWEETYLTTYMPTEKRLNEKQGNDWY